jgi:hypothetical protein
VIAVRIKTAVITIDISMLKILSVFIFICFLPAFVYGQIIDISGKVVDGKTHESIPGASLKIGPVGTSTDRSGEFNLVVQQSIIQQYGITVSCLGYQKKQIGFNPGEHYEISLQPAVNALREVTISANGESIVQKAIRLIPKNYPVKDFMMEGFLQIYHLAKDSIEYYKYYKNEAVIRMHYPSYLDKTKTAEVTVVENKAVNLLNVQEGRDTVEWVNGYFVATAYDIVHSRSGPLSKSNLHKLRFVVDGKAWVNNTRVFVINYFTEAKNDETGTLYIDTASYAIVKNELTRYNVKQLFFITMAKISSAVNYRKQNGKWYVDNVKITGATKHDESDLYSTIDYKTIAIDTLNIKPLGYLQAIQSMTEDVKINNAGTPENQAKYAGLFKNVDTDTLMTHIEQPIVDTVKPKQKLMRDPLNEIIKYLRGDNARYIFEFSRLPVTIQQSQPGLNSGVDPDANYALGVDFQLRIFKGLFFESDNGFNWGIGGVSNTSNTYGLTYNFILNKKHRPLTISPMIGYATLRLSQKNVEYYNQTSLVPGLSIAYERSHRWSYYLAAKYYHVLSSQNLGINLVQQKVTPIFGFIYKL